MKENAGYTIRRSILFDNACGVVLGENPHAPAPFVTWRFNEQDGHRDYFWGHYHTNFKQAEADLAARAGDYQRQYRVRLVEDTGLARAAFSTMGHGWGQSANPRIKKICALPSMMLSQKAPPILPTFCGSWRSPGMRSSMGAAV